MSEAEEKFLEHWKKEMPEGWAGPYPHDEVLVTAFFRRDALLVRLPSRERDLMAMGSSLEDMAAMFRDEPEEIREAIHQRVLEQQEQWEKWNPEIMAEIRGRGSA